MSLLLSVIEKANENWQNWCGRGNLPHFDRVPSSGDDKALWQQ